MSKYFLTGVSALVLFAAFAANANAAKFGVPSDHANSSVVMQIEMYGNNTKGTNGMVYTYVRDSQTGRNLNYYDGYDEYSANYGSSQNFEAIQPSSVFLTYSAAGITNSKNETAPMQITWTGNGEGNLVKSNEAGYNYWADITHFLNKSGVTWMRYALVDYDSWDLLPETDWSDVVINYVDNNDPTKGWTAEFAINRAWIGGMGIAVQFGDAPYTQSAVAPEPATLALFGLGLGGLALARRRKK